MLLALSFVYYKDVLIMANLMIVLGLQTVFFIRKLNRVNHDLENFFQTVKNNDTSVTYRNKYSQSGYDPLFLQFDLINNRIQEIKIENENKNQYFSVLVEHVGIGLISFNDKGNVSIYNGAAKELFKLPHLFHIKQLDRIQKGISALILNLRPSEQKLIPFYRNHEMIQLSVKSSVLKLSGEKLTLVSFQNIKNELEERELDSWQKLIRVLTHEMINSISPVNSSLATLIDLYRDEHSGEYTRVENINSEIVSDTVEGLEIIDERIEGLIDFVSRFRDLTLLPRPNFVQLNLVDRVKNLSKLLADQLLKENIEIKLIYSKDNIEQKADSVLLDQILINLLKNSIQALEGRHKKVISIIIDKDDKNRSYIEVVDNGCGINKEFQDEVFVPFYTSKKNGSGIGLSLSRQLMRLHGGMISFRSEPNVETRFRLQF
jgi:nitrogen fixation/metabolism regulation signal transduction histidine kinase